MAEFVSGLPLLNHSRKRTCVKFISCIQTDIRVGCMLWLFGWENVIKRKHQKTSYSWRHPTQYRNHDRPSIVRRVEIGREKRNRCQVFLSTLFHRLLIRFVSFSTLQSLMNGKRHILKSDCCCHLGRCCFIFLYLSHFVCTAHSTVIHLWNIASVFHLNEDCMGLCAWRVWDRESLES